MQPEDTFSALGNDIGHLNSSWQLDRVGIPEYSVVDFMNEYQMYGAGRVQPTLLSQFANRSGEALDWFIDGYTEAEKDELIPLNWPVVEGYNYKKGPFTSYVGTCQFGGSVGMTDAVKRSQEKAKAAGAQFVYGQAAVRLVHNEDGTEVTGVIAKDSNSGEYTQYNGRAVVLACGDIGSNSAMYNAICRENYELGEYKDCSAMSGRDGSGIAMAMRIGAKVEIATGGDMGSHAFIPLSPMEGVECLWLNKYGECYCNEAFFRLAGRPRLPGVGQRLAGSVPEPAGGNMPRRGMGDASPTSSPTPPLPEGDDTGQIPLRRHRCGITAGMEEGVKANTLAAIEKWNAAHDAGIDTEFGRDPETMWPIKDGPFYGYPCSKRIGGGSLVATSGLLVTGRQQVQGQGFEPIKGLFACGNTSGGRFPMDNGIMNGVHRHVPVPRLHVGRVSRDRGLRSLLHARCRQCRHQAVRQGHGRPAAGQRRRRCRGWRARRRRSPSRRRCRGRRTSRRCPDLR